MVNSEETGGLTRTEPSNGKNHKQGSDQSEFKIQIRFPVNSIGSSEPTDRSPSRPDEEQHHIIESSDDRLRRRLLEESLRLIDDCLNQRLFLNGGSHRSEANTDVNQDDEVNGDRTYGEINAMEKITEKEPIRALDQVTTNRSSNFEIQRDDGMVGRIVLLGQGALENCVPPPYRTPTFKEEEDLTRIGRNRKHIVEENEEESIRKRRKVLKLIKPWKTFTKLPNDELRVTITNENRRRDHTRNENDGEIDELIEEEEYDLLNYSKQELMMFKQPDSNQRGFWLIPIWKYPIDRSDFYWNFANRISLPTWTIRRPNFHDRHSTGKDEQQDIGKESIKERVNECGIETVKAIEWNPIRLIAIWKLLCTICEKQKLGRVMAHAIVSKHDDSSIFKEQEQDSEEDGLCSDDNFDDGEDKFGDHIRVWTSLGNSMILRRFLSDINLRSVLSNYKSDNAKRHKSYKDHKIKDMVNDDNNNNKSINNNSNGIDTENNKRNTNKKRTKTDTFSHHSNQEDCLTSNQAFTANGKDESFYRFEKAYLDELNEGSDEEELNFKWMKGCKFMWFDQCGFPRGYS
ncbi:expressed protein [Phakopsora pachyrhizi]|uniref:Expressed protein n=1 Tax=Phakopsora pachyrhizi TaxID=170000 RepID=A0AAV0B4L5_PHAPC|nr:expressed protein [Phakopsora pachyrhizi]